MNPTRPCALAALALVLTTAVACSSAKTAQPTAATAVAAPSSAANTIVIANFAFKPVVLTVRPGAKVTVRNTDSTAHTVTASPSKAFDTHTIGPGKTASFTAPTKPGTYPYICSIHQFMHGTLTVK